MTAASFDTWLDDFFASYYRRRPVNATFIGRHGHDDRLPDLSPEGVDRAIEEISSLQARLEEHPPETLSETQQLDRRLAAGALAIQEWEYDGDHFHRSNPCIYTGEAIFGVLSLFLTEFAPLDQRVSDAVSRMRAIPGLLEQGMENIDSAPEAWLWRARDEVAAARAFFDDGIETLAAQKGIENPAVEEAAATALEAFERFEAHLNTIPGTTDYAAGETALELVVNRGHFREESLAEIVSLGEEQLAAAQTGLQDGLDEFDAETPAGVLDGLKDDHPSVEEYYERHTELWEQCREIADGRFIDWPDYPLEFVPRPEWVREAAQDLYFLFYRAPAPFDDITPVKYLLEPVDESLQPTEQEQRLRRWNTAEIKLNHVAHHGGLGHHVQNHRAYTECDSRVGRMAAVDTPYRIALCCGGTMAEGWSPYATELMAETEFLTAREEYSLHATRRRMAARAIVDVKLHTGEMSGAEAMGFYQKEAGMGEWGAKYEVVKNSMFPGMALMYLLGTKTIRDLRADLADRLGEEFELTAFHEDFLSAGSIPVTLNAQRMRENHG